MLNLFGLAVVVVVIVIVIPGKGCGFVQFVHREMAINQMQGYPIGTSLVEDQGS